MLTTLKNRLIKIITDNGFSLDLFGAQEDNSNLLITLADTPLYFSMEQSETDFNQFKYIYTRFRPGYPEASSSTYFDFDILEISFNVWVKNDVKNILEEIDAPDFWKQQEELINAIPSPAPPEDEIEEFTEDEKNQARVSVEEFRTLLVEHFHPIDEQLKEVNERLDYLNRKVDKLNRFDWRALAITTAWDIGVLMGLDPDSFRKLSELFTQGFANISGLLN